VIDADAIAAAQYFASRYGWRALTLTRNIADAHRSTANEHAPFWHQVALMVAAIVQAANSP
jgi:hypothetical protein